MTRIAISGVSGRMGRTLIEGCHQGQGCVSAPPSTGPAARQLVLTPAISPGSDAWV